MTFVKRVLERPASRLLLATLVGLNVIGISLQTPPRSHEQPIVMESRDQTGPELRSAD